MVFLHVETEFGTDISNHCLDIEFLFILQIISISLPKSVFPAKFGGPPSWIFKNSNFQVPVRFRISLGIILQNVTAIS